MVNDSNGVVVEAPTGEELPCCEITVEDSTEPFVFEEIAEVGETYTFSAWIRSNSPSKFTIGGEEHNTTTDWAFVECTFVADNVNLNVYFDVGTFYLFQTKLEEGDKCTNFSLNPIDSEWSYIKDNGLPAIDPVTEKRVISGYLIAGETITGDKIVAKTITATQINTTDLFAQDIQATGTIRGLNLVGSTMESGSLKSANYDRDEESGMFIDLSKGTIDSKNLKLDEDGNVKISGDISGSAGTFSGELRGASGTFSGSLQGADITGATGKFSGELSAATGNFQGTLRGADITGASGIFSGDVVCERLIAQKYSDDNKASITVSNDSVETVNGVEYCNFEVDQRSNNNARMRNMYVNYNSVAMMSSALSGGNYYATSSVEVCDNYSFIYGDYTDFVSSNNTSTRIAGSSITHLSDETLKDLTYDVPPELLYELKPIRYTWKDSLDETVHFGLGARHTKDVFENHGITNQGIVCEIRDSKYGVNYNELHGLEIATIQAQKKKIDELEERIAKLESLVKGE